MINIDPLKKQFPKGQRNTLGSSLVVQWVRLRASNAGGPGRSLVGELDPACMLQLRVHMLHPRSLHAATKSLCATTKSPHAATESLRAATKTRHSQNR